MLTFGGQLAVSGGIDLHGVFEASPGDGHAPTFPATMPLAGAAFVAVLQLTLGLVSFDAPPGSGLYSRDGPLTGAEVGAALVAIGVWQVLLYVVLQGRPFAGIASRAARLVCANAVVLGGHILTYVLLRELLGWETATIGAAGGSVIAAGLVVGMLFEGWLASPLVSLPAVAVLGGVLYVLLTRYADGLSWTRVEAADWVSYAGLNAIGIGVILHVAIGKRFPFASSA